MNSADKMNVSEEATANDEGPWTIEVPFQHVYVKASAQRIDLGPEAAMDFIESEFETLCRVELYETACDGVRSVTDASAWQMLAHCPFCPERDPLVLEGGNWVRIHDWSREEFDTTVQTEDEYVRAHDMDIKVLCDDVGTDRYLTTAFFSRAVAEWGAGDPISLDAGFEVTPERNVYGLSLGELRAALSSQTSPGASEAVAEELGFGVDGYFGGLYRCPHCGGIFAVIYRDPCNPLREGRYELFDLYGDTLDELMGTIPPHGPFNMLVPHVGPGAQTMSVDVERRDGSVVLTTNIAGVEHQLAFNTRIGTFLLDGSSYVHDSFCVEGFFEHPLEWSELFAVRELVECVSRLLPPLPEGVDFHFDPGRSTSNLLLLIAANRFVGYPASFYNEVVSYRFPWSTYPLRGGLPRDYAELPRFFEMTGLPDDEALERVLLARPEALHAVLGMPDVPFWSADVLCRFFELPEVERLLRFVNYRGRSCAGWRWLASMKGERAVLDFIATQPGGVITDMSNLLNGTKHEREKLTSEDLDGMSLEDVEKMLTYQRWQRRNPDRDLDKSFRYDDFAMSLPLEVGKYSFVLPGSPRDFLTASVELRKDLNMFILRAPLPSEPIVVFVLEDGRTVAGIRVKQDGNVITALAKGDKPIERFPELNEAFEHWMEQKSLHCEKAEGF